MNKILIAVIGLILVATPALACMPNDPACGKDTGDIATYFNVEDGKNVWFNDALLLNPDRSGIYADGLIDSVSTRKGDVYVLQNVDLLDSRRYTDAVSNTLITIDPEHRATANIEKSAWWDGTGEVYIDATLGKTVYIVDAGSHKGDAQFANSISYKGDLSEYQSVGLGTLAVCVPPVLPKAPTFPTCKTCNHPTG